MRRWVTLGLAIALASAACGHRMSRDEIVSQLDASSGRSNTADTSATDADAADLGAGEPVGPAAGDTAGTGTAGARASGGAATGGRASASGAPSPSGSGSGAAPGGDTSPIVVASVSALSGPAGAAQAPGVQAIQIWVRLVNDRGGVAGHPVKYLVADDGSDPARHRAAVQDMVENKGAIAFVGQYASQTHQAARSYIESKKIPVIGGEATLDLWFQSPMYFSQTSADIPDGGYGRFNTAARFAKGKKLASLVCQEAQVCTDSENSTREMGPANGFDLVYTGKGSLAQPDFTAECLSMRNAGADVVSAVFDLNSVKRIASSCARQNYRPQFILGIGVSDNTNATLAEFDGATGSMPVFPFIGIDNAATKDYFDAYRRYAPGVQVSPIGATGWVAAKMFEKAAARIGAGKPTTAKLLEGLYAMNSETLDGLTAGLTFAPGKGSAPRGCWYPMVIAGGKWTAPDGMTPTCRK